MLYRFRLHARARRESFLRKTSRIMILYSEDACAILRYLECKFSNTYRTSHTWSCSGRLFRKWCGRTSRLCRIGCSWRLECSLKYDHSHGENRISLNWNKQVHPPVKVRETRVKMEKCNHHMNGLKIYGDEIVTWLTLLSSIPRWGWSGLTKGGYT